MTCKPCQLSEQQPNSGAYNMKCQQCCARLVASTHPDRAQAAAMMKLVKRAINRWSPTFGLDDVKASVRLILGKRP